MRSTCQGDRRSVLYVPDELAEALADALSNGQKLQELIREVGKRYVKALKAKRSKP